MSTPIRIKRSAVAGKRPTTAQLQLGELALNFYDGHLYAKRDTSGVGIGTTTALLTPWKENFGAASIYYDNSVGIVTTLPSATLDVDGTLNVSGISTFGNRIGIGTTAPQASIHIYRQDTVGGVETHADFILENPGRGNARIFLKTRDNNRNWEFFADDDDGSFGIYDGVANKRTFAISTSSYVGIGTIFSVLLQPRQQLDVAGNAHISGDVGIGSINPTAKLDVDGTVNVIGISTFKDKVIFDSTNSIQIPVGVTTQRDPSPVAGQIRYNSELSSFEGYGPGNAWGSLGGVKDVDGDTYIIPEVSAGSDEDTLYFYTAGSNAASISSTTTTLNTDLSVSGVSTFQGNVNLGDNDRLRFGDVGDLQIYHNSSNNNSIINESGPGNLIIGGDNNVEIKNTSGTEFKAKFITDGAVELYHGMGASSAEIKFETTGIGVSIVNGTSDTATITGPENLIIDPAAVGDNTGLVRIKGDLYVDGTTTQINSTTIELADFIVGIATTATTDLLSDGAGIQIGPNNTFLYEYNGGTNPSLKSSENLNVASGKVYQIAETERLSTDTLSLGTGTTIHSPASNTLTLGTNGQERVRITSAGDVGIGTDAPTAKLDVRGTLNVTGVSTFQGNVHLLDNDELHFGGVGVGTTNGDLRIYHDGTDSYISEQGTGLLSIDASYIRLRSADGNKNTATFAHTTGSSGGVQLYWDGNKKFETTGAGVTITGIATAATFYAQGGTYNAGSDTRSDVAIVIEANDAIYTRDTSDGYLRNLIGKQSNVISIGQTNTALVDGIKLYPGALGSVKLYHGAIYDDLKFETTGVGVTVYGELNVSGISTFSDDVTVSRTLTVGSDIATGISGGAPTDEGVLAVYTTGTKNALIIQTETNGNSRGIAFRNSADAYIGYISMEDRGGNLGDMVFGVGSETTSNIDNVDERFRITKEGDLLINEITTVGVAVSSLTTLTQTGIHTMSASTYRSVEYNIQATQGTNFHSTKILALHNGTTAYHNEYGTIYNNTSVATFDVDISGGNIRLLATGASASQTDYVVNFTATKV